MGEAGPALERLLLVGCGNMAGAMLAGWIAGGIEPARFTVVDPALPAAPEGVTLLREIPREAAFDGIMLGVKPQGLDALVDALEPLAGPGTTILSILAGVELASLAARFPRAAAVVRIMPNLAARIGRSPVGLDGQGAAGAALPGPIREALDALMAPLGSPEWLAGEAQFDAVTALVGSGPAFVYRFIDALAAAGVDLGLPEAQARRMAVTMAEGAARLAAGSDLSPGDLADRVASRGGSTRSGLDVFDADEALGRVVTAALTASRDRNAEMAAEARG